MTASRDDSSVAPVDLKWATLDPSNCSIGHVASLVGDRWSWLILRELMFGVDRFDTIQSHLGVSRRTLTERLDALVAHELVERVPYQTPGQRLRYRYALTRAGSDLIPVLIAFREWGDRYRPDDSPPPVVLRHRGCGRAVHLHLVCDAGHAVTQPADLQATAGPGARPLAPTG